ncbi:hypothetical protein CEXT_525171 [Caerostris extrusa]|uniref:CUB domain-containing protein n=1 Tax=Caerostris extrusa TaxID=172846 RepID=A0AAV4XHG1_CAEEX|nr:hypothetical protein CEXT_525171 [Caerostris extrusa]
MWHKQVGQQRQSTASEDETKKRINHKEVIRRKRISSSEDCSIESGFNGTIEESIFSDLFKKCWKIIIPPGSFVRIILERYTSTEGCEYSTIEVTIPDQYESYTLCADDYRYVPIIGSDDVKIVFNINAPYSFSSSFKMKYQMGKYLFMYNHQTYFLLSSSYRVRENKFPISVLSSVFLFPLFTARYYVTGISSSEDCSIESGFNGTIEESIFSDLFKKCWKIIVPPGSFVRIILERYTSTEGCEYSTIEVTIPDQYESHTLCADDYRYVPIIGSDDVKIVFNINTPYSFSSSFKIKYQMVIMLKKHNSEAPEEDENLFLLFSGNRRQ